ncbi:MAG: hypothetical protein RMH75_06220 [Archaeoglobaceae archaeon]|nr:hypothetical protein [Archaeoglobaceae archaeon]
MIILLLAILSTTSAFQGEVVNLTLPEQSMIYLDNCMFFEHSLRSSENLSPGTYRIVVGYGCEGLKSVVVRTDSREDKLILEVRKQGNISEEITKIHKELLSLRRENENLSSRVSYLQSLVEIINSINVDLYDRIKEYAEKNLKLNEELESARDEIQNCSKNLISMRQRTFELQNKISELEKQNYELNTEIRNLKNYLQSSAFYLEVFKEITILLIAFIVGILLSFLRRY